MGGEQEVWVGEGRRGMCLGNEAPGEWRRLPVGGALYTVTTSCSLVRVTGMEQCQFHTQGQRAKQEARQTFLSH